MTLPAPHFCKFPISSFIPSKPRSTSSCMRELSSITSSGFHLHTPQNHLVSPSHMVLTHASFLYLCSSQLSAGASFAVSLLNLWACRGIAHQCDQTWSNENTSPCSYRPCTAWPPTTSAQVTLHSGVGTSLSCRNSSTDPNPHIFVPFPLIIRIFFLGILVVTFLIVSLPLFSGLSTFQCMHTS